MPMANKIHPAIKNKPPNGVMGPAQLKELDCTAFA